MSEALLFWGLVGGLGVTSLLFLASRNMVHILVSFSAFMGQISCFFILLDAVFLGLLFLLFYGGMSIFLLMFHLMTQEHHSKTLQSFPRAYRRISVLACLVFFCELSFILVYKKTTVLEGAFPPIALEKNLPRILGEIFYTEYPFVFLFLGILYFVGIMGIVLILGGKRVKGMRPSSFEKTRRDGRSVELKDGLLTPEEKT